MKQLIGFEDWLLSQYGNKNTTKNYYYNMYRFFSKFSSLSQENINKYASFLVESGKKKETQNKFVASLKAYFKFKNITNLTAPSYKGCTFSVHEYITEKELNRIVSEVPNILTHHERDTAILKLLFYTGIRKDELVWLKRENFNFKNQTLLIQKAKGDEQRVVPLAKKIIKDIQYYFNCSFEETNAFNISTYKIDYLLKRINEEKIIDKHLHAHLFRHSCSRYLEGTKLNNIFIMEMLGHKSFKTTERYLKPDGKLLQEAYKEHVEKSPR